MNDVLGDLEQVALAYAAVIELLPSNPRFRSVDGNVTGLLIGVLLGPDREAPVNVATKLVVQSAVQSWERLQFLHPSYSRTKLCEAIGRTALMTAFHPLRSLTSG